MTLKRGQQELNEAIGAASSEIMKLLSYDSVASEAQWAQVERCLYRLIIDASMIHDSVAASD